MENNELKIELYPKNEPRYEMNKESAERIITKDTLECSFDKNSNLAYINTNVPFLCGLYTAHTNHYPIRLKPDDIWLLIIQAFNYHVNSNAEELRHLFVDFDGKKTLKVIYIIKKGIEEVDKKKLEDFSEQINEQMIEYLGEELLDILTPNFSTTNYDSKIIGKISIMGAFQKYFNYKMTLCGCGSPYLILEGTAEDYQKIIDKANKLSKYDFDWFTHKIIPHIQKMKDAKEGKIDVDFFKSIIQKKEVIEKIAGPSGMNPHEVKVDYISGWILNFFPYFKYKDRSSGKTLKFEGEKLKVEKFNELANQMLSVPFVINDELNKKTYSMEYKVGFIGCDQNNQKEVFPVQGWLVKPQEKKIYYDNIYHFYDLLKNLYI